MTNSFAYKNTVLHQHVNKKSKRHSAQPYWIKDSYHVNSPEMFAMILNYGMFYIYIYFFLLKYFFTILYLFFYYYFALIWYNLFFSKAKTHAWDYFRNIFNIIYMFKAPDIILKLFSLMIRQNKRWVKKRKKLIF